MADRLANSLTTITGANLASGDYFIALDVSDTTDDATGTVKKILRSEVESALGSLPPTKQILTVGSGTYNLPAGCTLIKITGVAGGGGGGASLGSTTQASACTGGASGGWFTKWIASPASSYAYTAGAKGTGGAAGANNGNPGSDTTFSASGSLLTAKGGGGGLNMALGTTVGYQLGGNPGGVSTDAAGGSGTFIGAGGQPASNSIRSTAALGQSTAGGSGPHGSGGIGRVTDGAGNAGTGYGSGGSGALVLSVNTARAGGDGADGVIIVEEFYG